MADNFQHVFQQAWRFYLSRLKLILVFSVPFLLALIIPVLVAAPTYLALGGVFLRTGSIPELSILDALMTAAAYFFTVFLISDTIVNVNLIVKSRRTLTEIKKSVITGIGTYAMRIFFIYTIMLLLMFVFQLITYDNPLQSWLYPLFVLALSFLLFFVAPAIVIDHSDTPTAMRRSARMAMEKPVYVLLWAITGLVMVSATELIGLLIFSSPFSQFFVMLVNSFFILPLLVILQTMMYMEKYPLSR
ncbi:MAG: hypothetical protein ABII71_05220 [Candidatus Micrarchaeota archaeon]